MKIIVSVVILFATTMIGNSLTYKYKERCVFFTELYCFLIAYQRNLAIEKSTVIKVVENLEGQYKKCFIDSNSLLDLKFLKIDEIKHLKLFIDNLGRSDSKTEIEKVKGEKEKWKQVLDSTEKERKKQVPLHLKLGVTIGAMVVVVLI